MQSGGSLGLEQGVGLVLGWGGGEQEKREGGRERGGMQGRKEVSVGSIKEGGRGRKGGWDIWKERRWEGRDRGRDEGRGEGMDKRLMEGWREGRREEKK